MSQAADKCGQPKVRNSLKGNAYEVRQCFQFRTAWQRGTTGCLQVPAYLGVWRQHGSYSVVVAAHLCLNEWLGLLEVALEGESMNTVCAVGGWGQQRQRVHKGENE
ncbi:hypothetical protein IMCC20628_02725 [Hoeflea sp. IMCC20628]|nr:hypothetical protein IMCC20628_02725 [Hoeflea sp. IMCC20628]